MLRIYRSGHLNMTDTKYQNAFLNSQFSAELN